MQGCQSLPHGNGFRHWYENAQGRVGRRERLFRRSASSTKEDSHEWSPLMVVDAWPSQQKLAPSNSIITVSMTIGRVIALPTSPPHTEMSVA
jgi:hypothetical protein